MANETKCEECGKTFNGLEAKRMHFEAKHQTQIKKTRTGFLPKQSLKIIATVLIALITLAGILFLFGANAKTLPPTDIKGHVEEIPAAHILKEPMPLLVQKHMLEHADGKGDPGVIINYDCEEFSCEPGMIEKLEDFAKKHDFVYVAPFKNMRAKIAVTRLNKIETMNEYNQAAIERFIG